MCQGIWQSYCVIFLITTFPISSLFTLYHVIGNATFGQIGVSFALKELSET